MGFFSVPFQVKRTFINTVPCLLRAQLLNRIFLETPSDGEHPGPFWVCNWGACFPTCARSAETPILINIKMFEK